MVWLPTATGELIDSGYPCWKFTMGCFGETYHTFVDMITGEIHLYIQVV